MKKFIIFFLIFASFFTIGSGGVLASKTELPTDVKDIIKNIREKHKDSLDSATITRIIPDIFKEIFRKSFPTISQFSAINTLRLGGKTENSFLKNKLCENGKVYKSVGADGQPICGYKNEKMMLVRVFSGSVEAGSKNNRITYNTGEDISFNEEINIRTTNQEAVLQFADNSIIRLAKKTGILLGAVSSKNTSNNTTIAQVSLDGGGLLWGRVLNSEIQFRSGDVIAGVRGTSIALSDNNNQKTIEIIDSRNPTNAAILYNNDGKQLATLGVQERYHIDGGRKEIGLKKSEQWKRHEFFRESERNDHIYISTLIDKIENQKQNIGIRKEILKEESTASEPTITAEHEALCGPGKVFWKTELDKAKQCKSKSMKLVIDLSRGIYSQGEKMVLDGDDASGLSTFCYNQNDNESQQDYCKTIKSIRYSSRDFVYQNKTKDDNEDERFIELKSPNAGYAIHIYVKNKEENLNNDVKVGCIDFKNKDRAFDISKIDLYKTSNLISREKKDKQLLKKEGFFKLYDVSCSEIVD